MALLIDGDESWTTNLKIVPTTLSPATKMGNGIYRHGGDHALKRLRFWQWNSGNSFGL